MAATEVSEPQNPVALLDLFNLRPGPASEPTALAAVSAVERGLAGVKAYGFASVDYPAAAWSFVGDTNKTTTVGYFIMDPTASPLRQTAFTFTGGVYRIITVPNATSSFAAGINTAGTIVGQYTDAAGKSHGFKYAAGAFTNVDVPNATS